jgi:hypothetical protein
MPYQLQQFGEAQVNASYLAQMHELQQSWEAQVNTFVHVSHAYYGFYSKTMITIMNKFINSYRMLNSGLR